MNPILSIVIPTKNRYRTLTCVVGHMMTWDSRDFEIVIQDNSDDDSEVLAFLEQYQADRRLKYFRRTDNLSATENCELAIEHSSGEFICFLGDDDGVARQIIPVVKWMRANDIDSVNCLSGYYCWPDYRYRNWGRKLSYAGICLVPQYSGTVVKIDARKELDRMLQRGASSIAKMPKLYHGIVSKRCLTALQAQVGKFFPGPVPDMASSVGLSFFVQHHVYLDFPLVIAGISGNSMAGRGGRGSAHGQIEAEPSLPADAAAKWSPEIPKYWAPKTIWPEAAMQALKAAGHTAMTKQLNLPRVYAELYMDTPMYRKQLKDFINGTTATQNLAALKRRMRWYKGLVYLQRFRSTVKRCFVLFDAESLLGFSKITGDTVAVVMEKLDVATDDYLSTHQNDFTVIVKQYNGK